MATINNTRDICSNCVNRPLTRAVKANDLETARQLVLGGERAAYPALVAPSSNMTEEMWSLLVELMVMPAMSLATYRLSVLGIDNHCLRLDEFGVCTPCDLEILCEQNGNCEIHQLPLGAKRKL